MWVKRSRKGEVEGPTVWGIVVLATVKIAGVVLQMMSGEMKENLHIPANSFCCYLHYTLRMFFLLYLSIH